jgi:prepilin-type N-terminal cleavage/methylation domain-containing protein
MHRARGFTLIEMAASLAVLGAFVALSATALNVAVTRGNARATEAAVGGVDEAVVAYVQNRLRLPCADVNADGLGDCNAGPGQVPYRDLALAGPVTDGEGNPVRYVLNGSLAPPVLASNTVYDFCQALFSAARSVDASMLRSSRNINLAYAVIAGGARDIDNDGDYVDSILSATGNDIRLDVDNFGTSANDDRMRVRGLLSLAGQLQCTGEVVAVNTLENEIENANLMQALLDHNIDRYDDLKSGADTKKLMAGVAIATAVIQVAGAAATMIDAIGQGLVGNGAAIAAAAGGITAAASAVASIVEASLTITAANADIADANAKISSTNTYKTSLANVCNSSRTQVLGAKTRSVSCDS